jgi:hypothetical protein
VFRRHRFHPPTRSLLIAVTLTALVAFPAGLVLAGGPQFNDVPESNPFRADINALARTGVTAGCGGGNFCPKDFVTREQMAAFMNRLGALDPGKMPVVNASRLGGQPSTAFSRPIFAVVNANGTLARGSAGAASLQFGPGHYEVQFNRDVTGCAYTATLGAPGAANPTRGFIGTALRFGTTDAVFVETLDTSAALVDASFHLVLTCTSGAG